MTRKHFEKISKALKAAKPPAEDIRATKNWIALVRVIAAVCADDNPGFQRNTFLDACDF